MPPFRPMLYRDRAYRISSSPDPHLRLWLKGNAAMAGTIRIAVKHRRGTELQLLDIARTRPAAIALPQLGECLGIGEIRRRRFFLDHFDVLPRRSTAFLCRMRRFRALLDWRACWLNLEMRIGSLSRQALPRTALREVACIARQISLAVWPLIQRSRSSLRRSSVHQISDIGILALPPEITPIAWNCKPTHHRSFVGVRIGLRAIRKAVETGIERPRYPAIGNVKSPCLGFCAHRG